MLNREYVERVRAEVERLVCRRVRAVWWDATARSPGHWDMYSGTGSVTSSALTDCDQPVALAAEGIARAFWMAALADQADQCKWRGFLWPSNET